MKSVVIYYSHDGNCAMIAERIKAAAKADIIQLRTEDTKRRRGLVKYLWGGGQVAAKKKPALRPYTVTIDSYDLIFIGTPVWAASPAPALNSFLAQTRIANKKTALFCCHAGAKGKVFEKLRAALSENTIAGEIDFINPAKQDRREVMEKVDEWVKRILG
ncbi:MAG: NAD(P)H-dependent oxidoreductase [Spirochaetaceae bacterium]|jgi:flavodoxin|nr:NAD(P)H-dependent oxidoreductase [Spirochaetaceae bacterium]